MFFRHALNRSTPIGIVGRDIRSMFEDDDDWRCYACGEYRIPFGRARKVIGKDRGQPERQIHRNQVLTYCRACGAMWVIRAQGGYLPSDLLEFVSKDYGVNKKDFTLLVSESGRYFVGTFDGYPKSGEYRCKPAEADSCGYKTTLISPCDGRELAGCPECGNGLQLSGDGRVEWENGVVVDQEDIVTFDVPDGYKPPELEVT